MRRSILMALLALLSAAAAFAQAAGETRLLRYPDVYGDKIVFVYGGDLWLADAAGGTARRLTSDRGEELFPKFSPDGRQVAFTGQYSGNRQVHVIDVDGGAPRQLTFRNDIGELPPRGGYDNRVLGWTPDGKKVLFNANRVPWSERISRPYLVPATGGMETPLPMPEGAGGTLSPDGNRYAYTPIMREFRTWKRHYGGRAQDVWIYDLKNNTAERITDYKGTDNQPVWIGDTIYFTSDRDFFLNLYAYDTGTRQVRKVTNHNDYDVLWPSGDDRRVVYEAGGSIYLFDPASGGSRRVPIRVQGDLPHTLPYFKNVAEDIQSFAISPTGKRAVFGARGEVFTVPAEKGEARNLTRTPGVREMDVSWSPDGRWIVYLSDRTGEYEIYVRRSDGEGEERQVTRDGDIWRFPPVWSPDSRKLVFSDKKQRLRYVEVDGGRVVDVDKGVRNDIVNYRWAPDSRWLTYTKVGPNQFSSVWAYSLDKNRPYQLTSDLTNEAEPVFDPQGRYLYFLSNRDFNLTFSDFEFNYVYTDPTRVYVAVLSKDGPALFLPESDEEEFADGSEKPEPPRVADDEPAQGGKGKQGEEAETAGDAAKVESGPVGIDVDGFELRVRAIPGPSGNYRNLAANESAVFYLVGDGPRTQLKMYNLDERKEEVVLDGVQSFELSADGKKILFRQGQSYGIVDAKPGQKAAEHKLALDRLEMQIVPREEWRQMWLDAWRILRDWFYDPAMHGVDWKAMREKYGQMLPYAATRDDLDFLFGELGGELSAGHIYVGRGNAPGVERVENGLLGAEVEAHSSGYFRIAKIFPGENWHEDFRSPLTEPGVNVKAGDYILAVDGETAKGVDNFYRLLQNKGGRVVTLLVNDGPTTKGAREERVRPVDSEQNLRYLDWVLATRAKVEKASNGRIGYIHLPNTAEEGNRELFKYFYPLANKDALIIDDRYNGGGFIPDQMIALLSRPRLSYWARRGLEPNPTPGFAHTGPKVTLINGQAGSGGDAFPYYFKRAGLGPLIGTRTWGGLIGTSGNPSLLDGGSVSAASFRFFTPEGEWAVENEGVAPDLEVIDSPDLVAQGQDPSLETAISYLLGKLEQSPPREVKVPAPPKGGAPR